MEESEEINLITVYRSLVELETRVDEINKRNFGVVRMFRVLAIAILVLQLVNILLHAIIAIE